MSDVSDFVNNILQASSAMIALSISVLSVFAAYKDKNIDIAPETFNKVIWFLASICATLLWSLGSLFLDSICPKLRIMTAHGVAVAAVAAVLFVVSVIFLVYFILKNYDLARRF